jgi:hypothetical protein
MRFLMIMYPDRAAESAAVPDAKAVEAMMKYNEELAKAGVLLSLDGLHPTSKGARIHFPGGKPTVQDGPFTEAKEIVGGFWMLQVKSKEEAIEWAKRVPAAGTNFVELRQVFEMSDFPEDVQRAADNSTVKAQVEKHARA